MFPPGERGSPDYVNVLKNLGLTVLLPLVVGQVLRYFFPKQVKYLAAKLKFSIINSLALLCIVWSVFCDGVASDAFHRMGSVDIVAIIGTDIFMYLFGCAACIFIARLPWFNTQDEPRWISKWRFSRKDAAAIMVSLILGFFCFCIVVFLTKNDMYTVLRCYQVCINGYSFDQRHVWRSKLRYSGCFDTSAPHVPHYPVSQYASMSFRECIILHANCNLI